MVDLIIMDNFFDNLNREGCFDSQDMYGVRLNYRIVFANRLPDGYSTINDCLDSEGTLNENVGIIDIGDDGLIPLLWSPGININRVLSCPSSSIVVDLGDVNVQIVGVFLVDNATGYVIAYNIQDKGININRDQAIFPVQGMLLNIHTGVSSND